MKNRKDLIKYLNKLEIVFPSDDDKISWLKERSIDVDSQGNFECPWCGYKMPLDGLVFVGGDATHISAGLSWIFHQNCFGQLPNFEDEVFKAIKEIKETGRYSTNSIDGDEIDRIIEHFGEDNIEVEDNEGDYNRWVTFTCRQCSLF